MSCVRMMTILFLLVASLVGSLQAQTQATLPPVCTELMGGLDVPIPIADDFTVKVEVVTQETSRVTNMIMYYSRMRNMIRITMTDGGQKADMYYYFADNEILTFDYSQGRGVCTVNSDLRNAADTFIVGGTKDGKIPMPLAVLHFIGQSGLGSGEIKLAAVPNPLHVREMPVVAYTSCQKWRFGSQSAIFNVTHYFSDKSSLSGWTRADPEVVPILIELHGSGIFHDSSLVFKVDHLYNFFAYEPTVDPTIFETPPGIMCQGRNVDMPFPPLPDYMKFGAETVDNGVQNRMSYSWELYDVTENLAILKTQSPADLGTEGGMEHVSIIRDYTTGLSYALDNTNGHCQIQNISQTAVLPFDYVTPTDVVKMVTPEQFFYKANSKYEYLGERTVRGLVTDTYVTRTSLAQYPDAVITVEWYFAKGNVRSWNDQSTYYKNGKFRIPVLLRLWTNDNIQQSIDINIFQVDFTKVMFGQIDIKTCYPAQQNGFFQIVLQGAKEQVVKTNIDMFKWETTFILAQAAGVRWLRISDLKIYYTDSDTIIEFNLLDKPPLATGVAGGAYPSVSLPLAIINLQNAIQAGLSLKVWDSSTQSLTKAVPVRKNAVVSTPKPQAPTPNNDSGYTAGAMAGLGVAMLVVGGAAGGVGGHFFIK